MFFSAPSYAYEWSGDAAARFKATTVRVKPNETVTYNTALGRGTTVSGTITGPNGAAPDFWHIAFLDAVTGDEINDRAGSAAWSDLGGRASS